MRRRASPDRETLLAAERWLLPRPDPAARTVAVCYPNRYHVGMSNLGLHRLVELITTAPGWSPLRAFAPEPGGARRHPWTTLDGDLPLHRADLVAVSLSYEEDYGQVPDLLEAGGIPALAAERAAEHPPVVLGGFAVSLNPEPLALLADAVLLGPAEASLPELLRRLATLSAPRGGVDRAALRAALADLPGCYLPRPGREPGPVVVPAAKPRWEPGEGALRVDGAAPASMPGGLPPRSVILTPHTEFADRYLVAVGEGCPHGCRFCAAGFARRPPRAYPTDVLLRAVEEGLAVTPRIGLMGPAVTDLPGLAALSARVAEAGGELSTSSLRIGSLGGAELEAAVSLSRSATLAPEAGLAALRAAVNKPLSDDAVLDTVAACAAAGVHRVRLYLLVGLPGEGDEHVEGTLALVHRIRERLVAAGRRRGHVAELVLSVNPFVPKADTPLQWAPLAEPEVLRRRLGALRDGVRRVGGVQLRTGGERLALRQAILSLGGREAREVLALAPGRSGWWRELRRWHDAHGAFAFAERERGHAFPWDFIDRGVERRYLWREWQRYRAGKATPACDVARCTACGACG